MSAARLRVLVVEDDEDDTLLIRESLDRAGPGPPPGITFVRSAEEALSRLDQERFDALLVDYRLLQADGLELLREVRARGIDTPAIFLTGCEEPELAAEAMKAGASDYVSKSRLRPAHLVRSIQHAIELHEAQTLSARAEEAVRRSEERYRAIVDMAQEGIWVVDTQAGTRYVNRRMAEMIGIDQAELAPRSIEEFLHPEGREAIRKFVEAEARATGPLEVRFRRANGTDLWGLVSIRPTPSSGREGLDGIIMVVDITLRKQAEDSLTYVNSKLGHPTEELEVRSVRMHLLMEMGDLLHACRTEQEARAVVAERLPRLFPEESGSLNVLDASGFPARPVASWGARPLGEPFLEPEACWAVRRSRPHVVDPGSGGPGCNGGLCLPDHPAFCVPLLAEGRVLGVLHLSMREPGARTSEMKKSLAVSVAEHMALALANIHLREALHAQPVRDPMSDLFNRFYMEESLTQELARARRRGRPVGAIMIDLGFFHLIDDSPDRQGEGFAIREAGAFLRGRFRTGDIVAHHADEVFVAIMPDCGLEDTRLRADLLRRQLVDLPRPCPQGAPRAISLGVAAFPDHGTTAADLLLAAGMALEEARTEGRDRVVVAIRREPRPAARPGGIRSVS